MQTLANEEKIEVTGSVSLIKDTYEAYSEILSERTAQLQNYVIPIYAPNQKDVPVCVGSGNLIETSSRKFIVTAGHVIKDIHIKEKRTLYVPSIKGIAPIESPAQISADKHAPHIDDPFDICVIEVNSDTAKKIETTDHQFLGYDRERDTRFEADNFMVCFLGFPFTHNRGYVGKVKPKPYSFRSNLVHDNQLEQMIKGGIFDKIRGISPSTHYVMSFRKSQLVKDTGEKMTFPSMHGMSGSGLFLLSHISIESFLTHKHDRELIGVFHSGIEIDSDETLLVFTNHLPVSEMIRRFF